MRSYIIASYTLSGELARIQKDNIMLSFCFCIDCYLFWFNDKKKDISKYKAYAVDNIFILYTVVF